MAFSALETYQPINLINLTLVLSWLSVLGQTIIHVIQSLKLLRLSMSDHGIINHFNNIESVRQCYYDQTLSINFNPVAFTMSVKCHISTNSCHMSLACYKSQSVNQFYHGFGLSIIILFNIHYHYIFIKGYCCIYLIIFGQSSTNFLYRIK